MKKITLLLTFSIFICLVSGCGPMKGMTAASNRSKMNKIEVGMNRETVEQLMGKPYKRESYKGQEIWFYITDWQADGYTTMDEMTPFVFENNHLIGWGSGYIDEDLRKIELRVR